MKFILDRTPKTKKQIVESKVPSLTTNIVLKQTIDLSNPKMAQLFMHMLNKVLTFFVRGTTHTCPSTHTCRRELPSHLNHLALCTTQSHSLGVNPT